MWDACQGQKRGGLYLVSEHRVGGRGGGATTILHSQEPAHNAVYGVQKGHPVVGGVGCPLVRHQSLKPCT